MWLSANVLPFHWQTPWIISTHHVSLLANTQEVFAEFLQPLGTPLSIFMVNLWRFVKVESISRFPLLLSLPTSHTHFMVEINETVCLEEYHRHLMTNPLLVGVRQINQRLDWLLYQAPKNSQRSSWESLPFPWTSHAAPTLSTPTWEKSWQITCCVPSRRRRHVYKLAL
jgi:hypothetical protein